MTIHLRAFAKAIDLGAAEVIASKFLSTLREFNPKAIQAPKKYWKLEDHFEFAYSLTPDGSERMALESVLSLAGDGWQRLGLEQEPEAIWNQGSNSVFICPEVAWAHLELLPSRPNP